MSIRVRTVVLVGIVLFGLAAGTFYSINKNASSQKSGKDLDSLFREMAPAYKNPNENWPRGF